MERIVEHWWQADDARRLDSLVASVQNLSENQSYRSDMSLKNIRLFSNTAMMGLGASDYTGAEVLPPDRLTLNVVEAVVETAASFISSNATKVRFITEGGTRKDRLRAEGLTKFLSGQFYVTKFNEKKAMSFLDAAVFGTGIQKIFDEGKNLYVERVFPDEWIVDDIEARYGDPRNAFHVKDVERSWALRNFPEHKEQILLAAKIRDDVTYSTGMSDPISYIESWHLPSFEGAGDGKHVIGFNTCEVESGDWKEVRFPIVRFDWCKRLLGWWGKGIPEQLRGLQIEINMLLQKIQRLMYLASSKVFIQKGGKVNKAHMDNTEWGVVEYSGQNAPVFATIKAVAPEYYAQVESLYSKAFEITGVSMMAASGSREPGVESGRAVRELNDVQSQRFKHVMNRWDQFHLDVGDRMIEAAKRIARRYGDYSVVAETNKNLERITWKSVDPGKLAYKMKAWPASMLPDTPAGKIEAVQELLQIDPRLQPYSIGLLNMPDLEAAERRVNAPAAIVEKIAEEILDGGKYTPPEPYMDLQSSITSMQYAYLEASIDGVEEEKLDLMRRWMDQAFALLSAAQAALMQQSAPSPMPASPGAMPEQAPNPGASPGV